jgi:hypothetical protein
LKFTKTTHIHSVKNEKIKRIENKSHTTRQSEGKRETNTRMIDNAISYQIEDKPGY